MIDNRHKYRFYVDDVRIYLRYDQKYSMKYEKEDRRVFFRVKPNGVLKADRKAFDAIWAQDLDHRFAFRIDRHIGNGTYQTYVRAYFHKTDCKFDEDNRIAEIGVEAVDLYRAIIAGLDKEYDLIKEVLAPIHTVKYKKQPMLQVIFPNVAEIYNLIGDTFFVEELSATIPAATLPSFGFEKKDDEFGYIPGSGDMTPDVSGYYTRVGNFNGEAHYQNVNGIYGIKNTPLGPSSRWRIYIISTDATAYQLDIDEFLFTAAADRTFNGSNIFDSFTTDSQCKFFTAISYQRLLTDLQTVAGNPTILRPDPDVDGLTFGYNYYVDPSTTGGNMFANIVQYDANQTAPSQFGRFSDDALHFPGLYFFVPASIGSARAYPLFTRRWREYSLVVYRDLTVQDYQQAASSDVTLRNAYRLDEVLGKLLQLIDPTLSWAADIPHSSFLFNSTNPLTGDAQTHRYFISPKSNIVIGDYNNPATKSPIKLGQIIDELMPFVWQMYWWIDGNSMFRMEHIRYFTRGRSYTADVVSEDLTVQINPRNQKPWSFMTKKYSYRKQSMPEEYRYAWMDEVSEPFSGFPINMLSDFVEKGLKDERRISVFTSDIDYIQAVPDRVSLDGFAILAATLVDNVWTVPFTTVAATGLPSVVLQNGLLSMWYLHDKFHKYNLPARDINVNNGVTTATTTTRAKEQEVVMPSPMEPDPMRLITTSIGTGQVDSMEVIFETRECKLTVLHDLDFDNPAN